MPTALTSAIWQHSRSKGSELLLLLAIADEADDDGKLCRSMARLAQKIRLTDRNIRRILKKLEASRELIISRGAGRYGRHVFQINCVSMDVILTDDNLTDVILTDVILTDDNLPVMPIKKDRKLKEVKPLATDDWLRELLYAYAEHFDVAALDDDDWWANTGNSFPDFTSSWVRLAFASLARWLGDNPKRKPRTTRGWRQRMTFSLNWYYDKNARRTS